MHLSIRTTDSYGVAKNRYLIMRHGQAETNVRHIVSRNGTYSLTPEGRIQVTETARRLAAEEKIGIITCSPVLRAKETAEIVGTHVGIKNVSVDERFSEINFGIFERKSVDAWENFFSSRYEKLRKPVPEGESFADVQKRMMDGLMELEKMYTNKTILIISHDDPLWLLYSVAGQLDEKATLTLYMSEESGGKMFLDYAQAIEMPYKPNL